MIGKSFLSRFTFPRGRLALGAVGLLVLLMYLVFSVRGLRNSLREEVRDTRVALDRLGETVSLLTQDSEDLREALGLPVRVYPRLEREEAAAEGARAGEKGGSDILFYHAVENLLSHNRRLEQEKRFQDIMESPQISGAVGKSGLRTVKTGEGTLLERDGNPYISIGFSGGSGAFEARSFTGGTLRFDAPSPELAAFITDESRRLDAHFALLRRKTLALQEILRSPGVRDRLAGSGFVLEPPVQTRDALSYPVTMKVERDVVKLKVGLDRRTGRFFVGSRSVDDEAGLEPALADALAAVDTRTVEELRVEEVARQIQELSEDEGFRAYLKSKNLRLSPRPREDTDYLYFDFFSPSGEKAGALGIQRKVQGEIYLFDADDVALGALKTFGLAEEGKKKRENPRIAPAVSGKAPASSRTFLVVGAHEKMTDAIMLATVNEKRNDISLLSLPRDLFFRGRKINTLYVRHGPELFVRELAAMTGLPIEKYIIIDMYAFIDVINILGGLDITLKEDLVDPTYRIRVGGHWTTLFYPAGTHHLNGIEALRVARSRHFTSDFGRARRQQDMVMAIKDKLVGLGLKDLGKAYELMKSLVRYVDTNISPLEMVDYFFRYSDAEFSSRTVIDTDNLLYHSYTNLRHLNLKEEEVDEDFDKGAYILLPLEDDWESFRAHIRRLLDRAAV